jgi:hypothetical protein
LIFLFAKAFFLLMHTQYLTMSRMIGLKLHPSPKDRNDPKERERVQMFNTIRASITALEKEANSIMKQYEQQLRKLCTDLVARERENLLQQAREIEVCCSWRLPVDDNRRVSSINRIVVWPVYQVTAQFDNPKVFSATEFEKELFDSLVASFLVTFNKEFSNWLVERRSAFTAKLLELATNIQQDTAVLRDGLLHSDMNLHMVEVRCVA